MQQQKSFEREKEKGILYLVPTPIGNLEDMTFRAIRIMKEADLIAAEDTRNTKKLCNYFEIETPVTSYHEHNKESSGHKLIEKIKYFSLENNVELCGPKRYGEELFEYYRNTDIFVLSSHSEGTPRVLIEAMAFGSPIVATRVGGIPDIIEDGVNGILVEPREPISLANAIIDLIADDYKYKTISQNNISKAKNYTVDNLVKEMLKFISEHV